ncbi:hypothetical protein N780_01095 [Pontibacillus chungwhensis BH030062]|uniref:PepSY domain-containing protein n=1 Tax=Pontibacillus chungwhensis BH030062 TaxID=1385513 RepID=A0A0A2V0S3_9BACI|nr:hypothetical protein [Pontibacillus chungwhensis]KGP92366.1 hypothetical protein N780_01095 [Pontibacillus chungwhensis BH030062]
MKHIWATSLALMMILAGCTSDANQEKEANDDASKEMEQEQAQEDNNKEADNKDSEKDEKESKEKTTAEASKEREKADEETSEDKQNEKDEGKNHDNGSSGTDEDEQVDQPNDDTDQKQVPADLTKQEAKAVVNEYKKVFFDVIKNTDDNLMIKDYSSLEEIEKEFKTAMSQSLTDDFMSYYIRKENGKLYVVPSSAPSFLNPDQPISIERINDTTSHVVQTQTDEMEGNSKVKYVVVHDGAQWVVDDIQTTYVQEGSSETNQAAKEQAIQAVRNHLEINSTNDRVKVQVDHEESDKYLVHVYELVEQDGTSHTATIGWYYVDKKTGKVTDMMNP